MSLSNAPSVTALRSKANAPRPSSPVSPNAGMSNELIEYLRDPQGGPGRDPAAGLHGRKVPHRDAGLRAHRRKGAAGPHRIPAGKLSGASFTSRARGNPRPTGVPGMALCRKNLHGGASRPAQGPCRAPPGRAMRSALPATRQAAGAPSAWSQPSQSTHARPRRWRDAGPPGRQSVTAAQKAGDEGRVRDSDRSQRQDSATVNSGSGSLGTTRPAAETARGKPRLHRGAGHGFVPDDLHGGASPPAQGPCRAPPGGAMRSALPATRQAAGVPSAWSQPSQSTHERPRRWCDAGPLGRQSVTAAQKAGVKNLNQARA